MKKKNKILNFFLRYAILIAAAVPNLWIFYAIFTPLTVYPTYFLLNFFFGASLLSKDIILADKIAIEIIRACVAGSAYYLLLILNLSTPNIKVKKRVKMIVLSFAILLAVNVLRIAVLSAMFIKDAAFFDITHKLFWYVLSTVFVAAIWFWEVKRFRIKDIPFYSDLKSIFRN